MTIGSEDSQHRAQDALRYIYLQCAAVVANPKQMEQMVFAQRDEIKGKASSYIYDSAKLYYMQSMNSKVRTEIAIAVRAHADIGTKKRTFLRINIESLNANRVTPAIDALIQTFSHILDVRYSIVACAKAADQINRDIIERVPASSHCYCDTTTTQQELHGCEACGQPSICVDRRRDRLGRWACKI